MLETKFLSLSKAQVNLLLKPEPFALLREAKRAISTEFATDLVLHSKDILNNLHTFSMESKDKRLLEIYNQLLQYSEIEPQAVVSTGEQISITEDTPPTPNTKTAKISIGDIVDGKRCSGFYRGQPVFS